MRFMLFILSFQNRNLINISLYLSFRFFQNSLLTDVDTRSIQNEIGTLKNTHKGLFNQSFIE